MSSSTILILFFLSELKNTFPVINKIDFVIIDGRVIEIAEFYLLNLNLRWDIAY